MLWLLDPASGSVIANTIFVPVTIGRSQRSCCSAVPKCLMSSAQIAGETRMSRSGQPDRGELLAHDRELRHAGAAAAVLLGQVHAEEAELGDRVPQLLGAAVGAGLRRRSSRGRTSRRRRAPRPAASPARALGEVHRAERYRAVDGSGSGRARRRSRCRDRRAARAARAARRRGVGHADARAGLADPGADRAPRLLRRAGRARGARRRRVPAGARGRARRPRRHHRAHQRAVARHAAGGGARLVPRRARRDGRRRSSRSTRRRACPGTGRR